jgi:FKBP-type peptidyl-prolyl cis-trans isomerase FkpA
MKNFLFLYFILIFVSCGGDKKVEKPKITKRVIDSMVENLEIKFNKMEDDRIRDYISRHEPMVKTKMGFWYVVNEKNEKGREIKDGNLVKYKRDISLCNSDALYNDVNILKIGQGNEISGMHQALKLLRNGEKATFIFPSFLAHGLLGDLEKVPPKSELVYKVEIIDVK